jgi:Spy/CpxP family protein refolding chaperone
MTKRFKTALIVAATAAVAGATLGASAASAADTQPWCPINHVPWFLPCK